MLIANLAYSTGRTKIKNISGDGRIYFLTDIFFNWMGPTSKSNGPTYKSNGHTYKSKADFLEGVQRMDASGRTFRA